MSFPITVNGVPFPLMSFFRGPNAVPFGPYTLFFNGNDSTNRLRGFPVNGNGDKNPWNGSSAKGDGATSLIKALESTETGAEYRGRDSSTALRRSYLPAGRSLRCISALMAAIVGLVTLR